MLPPWLQEKTQSSKEKQGTEWLSPENTFIFLKKGRKTQPWLSINRKTQASFFSCTSFYQRPDLFWIKLTHFTGRNTDNGWREIKWQLKLCCFSATEATMWGRGCQKLLMKTQKGVQRFDSIRLSRLNNGKCKNPILWSKRRQHLRPLRKSPAQRLESKGSGEEGSKS